MSLSTVDLVIASESVADYFNTCIVSCQADVLRGAGGGLCVIVSMEQIERGW